MTAFGLAGFVFTFVAVIDPYNTLAFSPPMERMPVTTNQRYSYPAIAADPEFDSLVLGTSTGRLLQPSQLDDTLGGRFANLSMNSGTPWEQAQLLDLFMRHHPAPSTVIFTIDDAWCETRTVPELTNRPFPPWLYDNNVLNDYLYLFNPSAAEEAGRQLLQMLGLREPKYGRDGYRDFLGDRGQWSLARARENIYGTAKPIPVLTVDPPEDGVDLIGPDTPFPQLDILQRMLTGSASAERHILMIVPYHVFRQPRAGSLKQAKWAECKSRLIQFAAESDDIHFIDFMIPSAITRDDHRYWDGVHYSTETAEDLVRFVGQAVKQRRGNPDLYNFAGTRDGE